LLALQLGRSRCSLRARPQVPVRALHCSHGEFLAATVVRCLARAIRALPSRPARPWLCPCCCAHARRCFQLARPEFSCARRFPQLGFHQPPLSYPRQHATVDVFIEFANALLPIRLSSLLHASLRARRVLSVVRQHSCLPLARVSTRAPTCCHCSTLALRPSGFGVLAFTIESSNPSFPARLPSKPPDPRPARRRLWAPRAHFPL
jgi:hypothetical protein